MSQVPTSTQVVKADSKPSHVDQPDTPGKSKGEQTAGEEAPGAQGAGDSYKQTGSALSW